MFTAAFEFLGLAMLALVVICVGTVAYRAAKVIALESRKKSAQLQIEVDDREHARDVQRIQLGMRYDALLEHSDKMGLPSPSTDKEDTKITDMLEETERVRNKDIFQYAAPMSSAEYREAKENQRRAVDAVFE